MGNAVLFPSRISSYGDDFPNLKWCTLRTANEPDKYIPVLHVPAHPSRQGSISRSHPELGRINYKTKYLLYFHANSCDIGNVSAEMNIMSAYGNFNIIIMEYPGYGITKDLGINVTIPGLIDLWAATVVDRIENMGIHHSNIIIMGRSIGTGPAAKLAHKMATVNRPPGGLILHQPYTSIHSLLDDYTFVGKHLISDHWNTKELLESVDNLHLLLLHGDNDEIIGVRHSIQLMSSYRPRNGYIKEFYNPTNMGHNDYYILDDLLLPIHTFLRKVYMLEGCLGPKYPLMNIFEERPPDEMLRPKVVGCIPLLCQNQTRIVDEDDFDVNRRTLEYV
eukprot:GHVH01011093.1.p1 GENE.GHVH01011093.1~~GHVH01011093.1.p1  ORF type:complete len:334 (-),score=42.98 GHVH01011093.1:132-1133(-)